MLPRISILVLGAGPAGLAAAWQAARAGHEVTVVERSGAVGGMAGSFDVAGVRVDHGSHRLHPSTDPELLGALRTLLGDDLQTRPRHGRLHLGGRWIGFPLRTTDLVRHLPPRFSLGAARDALTGPFRRPRADTFAEVVRARLGPTVADGFYAPYARKLWGTDPSELSGELARRRVSAKGAGDIVARLARGRRTFLYPRRGFGQIAEALADAATAEGADVRLGSGARAVELRPDGTTVTLDDGTTLEGARVWSTVPLPALAAMAGGPEAGALRHRAMLLVYLVLDRPRYSEFDAHYVPDLDVPVARLSEPKNYRESADDPAGVTVLCAEVACWEGDERWNAADADLGAMVAESLTRIGLPAADPAEVVVRRLPRVYPLYRPGFEAEVAAVQAWEDAQPRLLSFGRQGLFVPDNTHHALAMGWAAARALRPHGSFDDGAWREARDGFRSHVVED